jgi:Leucine-rich repeat (LRR) protein
LLFSDKFEHRYDYNVVSCGISDESLKNLKLPPLLKRLSLVDNNISDAGAAIIREGCPPRMEELVLNLNFIKDIAMVCSLFDSLNIKIISDLQKYTSTQISERIRADFIYLML